MDPVGSTLLREVFQKCFPFGVIRLVCLLFRRRLSRAVSYVGGKTRLHVSHMLLSITPKANRSEKRPTSALFASRCLFNLSNLSAKR